MGIFNCFNDVWNHLQVSKIKNLLFPSKLKFMYKTQHCFRNGMVTVDISARDLGIIRKMDFIESV